MTGVYTLVIAMSVVVVILGLLVVGLLRSHAEILRRLESLGAGLDGRHDHDTGRITLSRKTSHLDRDVRVTGLTPQGEPVVTTLSAGSDPILVAFLSTTCSSCTSFWEGLESSTMYFGGNRHRVVIVTLGEAEESPTRAQTMAKAGADVIMSSTTWNEFGVPGAPYFVLIEPGTGSTLGEGSAMSYESLVEFLTDATNDQTWDLETFRSPLSEETRIDSELRRAGLLPDDPRLYHEEGDISEDGVT